MDCQTSGETKLIVVIPMPNCVILYHYYYPDDVVSARHFTDFAEGLSASGWDVRDKNIWSKALENIDVVVHLAAETGTGQSITIRLMFLKMEWKHEILFT
jgi:hypothetical protein